MLSIGQKISHYSVVSNLGKGGMGEVYRAKDQKLGREIAIKVLPEEFAKDQDRIARFQREAKLLASLNHPNIASIYGLEESEGTSFLVLELIEGETLADRLKSGPISGGEALKLALDIAKALEAAHEKGVIHRDLKPANIKITPEGNVKVLDFGLAKAYAGDREEVNLSNSPTLSDAATQQGVILGTAAYMSPEQARGKSVDKRADIWAFGCVLYEMLTGRAAFSGKDVTDILAAVIRSEPDWKGLPANLHGRLREVLERCLEKEANDRYHDISDLRVDIQRVLADPSGVLVQPITTFAPRTTLRQVSPWIGTTLVITAVIVGFAVWYLKPPERRQVMRFEYELPEGQQLSAANLPRIAVSPDGRQFAYSTTRGLYLRSIGELTAKPIAGTEESVQQPFFSPDGKWIGYYAVAGQQLKKISVNGGAPVTICTVGLLLLGACWASDDTIVYGQAGPGDIMRVSANGGTPEALVKAEPDILIFPQILPDNKAVLYGRGAVSAQRTIMVRSLASGETKELFAGGIARYLPTGHIVYMVANNPNIFAVPFDLGKLEVTGGPVSVVESTSWGDFSDSGTLIYEPMGASPQPAPEGRTLVWVDRNGKEEAFAAPPNMYRFPKISPDGTKVALTIESGDSRDIWIWDLAHKTLPRLTFEGGYHVNPIWASDGKRIAFYSFRTDGTTSGVYWKAADGTGENELLASNPNLMFFPFCWSRDEKYLVGAETPDLQAFDIGMISMEGKRERKPLLHESYTEHNPQISPDGRWMVYTSNESRKFEIYVRSFPDVNKGRWQISTSGGDSPLWSPDGRELFYLNGDAAMAVSVTTEPSFSIVGTPRILFRGTYVQSYPDNGTPWDISRDGKRFLMIKPPKSTNHEPAAEARPKINIVVNWFEELKQRVPVK